MLFKVIFIIFILLLYVCVYIAPYFVRKKGISFFMSKNKKNEYLSFLQENNLQDIKATQEAIDFNKCASSQDKDYIVNLSYFYTTTVLKIKLIFLFTALTFSVVYYVIYKVI